jgi:hypothetical protein
VDTSFADLDMSRCKNVEMNGNSYLGISIQVANPALVDYTQTTEANAWIIDAADELPFGGEAATVDSVMAIGGIRNSNNVRQYDMPYADTAWGPNRDQIQLVWPSAVSGRIQATIRMDSR